LVPYSTTPAYFGEVKLPIHGAVAWRTARPSAGTRPSGPSVSASFGTWRKLG
jgi:hypothetical protein